MLTLFFYILLTSQIYFIIYDHSCWSSIHCHAESCRSDDFEKNPDWEDFRNGFLERVYVKLRNYKILIAYPKTPNGLTLLFPIGYIQKFHCITKLWLSLAVGSVTNKERDA